MLSERDERGSELPDVAAVQRLARRYAGEVLREVADDVSDTRYWRMDTRQGGGAVIFTLIVDLLTSPAVAVPPPRPA